MKNDEHGAPWLEMQWHSGSAIGDLERCGLNLASIRMPQLCFFSSYVECGIESFAAIVAIVDIIKIAVREFPMHEQQIRIRFRFRVFEVRRDTDCGEDF